MSIETTCKNCGAEYDIRHEHCPACSIEMHVRSAKPPYETLPATGHYPFEMFGEQFAVTLIPYPLKPLQNPFQKWRVSHVATGAAIPYTNAATKEEARKLGKAVLAAAGEERFLAALRSTKSRFEPAASAKKGRE